MPRNLDWSHGWQNRAFGVPLFQPPVVSKSHRGRTPKRDQTHLFRGASCFKRNNEVTVRQPLDNLDAVRRLQILVSMTKFSVGGGRRYVRHTSSAQFPQTLLGRPLPQVSGAGCPTSYWLSEVLHGHGSDHPSLALAHARVEYTLHRDHMIGPLPIYRDLLPANPARSAKTEN